jgi:hypothetical protein
MPGDITGGFCGAHHVERSFCDEYFLSLAGLGDDFTARINDGGLARMLPYAERLPAVWNVFLKANAGCTDDIGARLAGEGARQ